MEHIGRVLIVPEPTVCPEVAIPARKIHPVHNETEWNTEAAYDESGYVEASK